MNELNSILLEGVITTVFPSPSLSSYSFILKNKREYKEEMGTIISFYSFIVKTEGKLAEKMAEVGVGAKVRVVGRLIADGSTAGNNTYIQAEHVEIQYKPKKYYAEVVTTTKTLVEIPSDIAKQDPSEVEDYLTDNDKWPSPLDEAAESTIYVNDIIEEKK
ncbi:MAG TPA: hypothetical protein PLR64_00470 [Candidatus Dojkabacteria bacterium]|nr:hypothetical protein [Candidatus Dojkabacteria bacterium]